MKGKRSKLTVTGSRDLFRATSMKQHPRNNWLVPMRGGIRM